MSGIPDKISADSTLHIYDVFDQFRLDTLLKKGTPKNILNDHWIEIELAGPKIYTVPLFLENAIEECKPWHTVEVDNVETKTVFNFMINKKQINRYLCLKFVELFDLRDYDYTWSGIGPVFDMSPIITEINQLGLSLPINSAQQGFLLSSVNIPPKFFYHDNSKSNNSNIVGVGGYVWVWNNGMCNIFSNSAISLITESVTFEKGAVFTEKTVYAILGLTLPIWIGGYRQADNWKKIGFDIFEDVIDHSYQHRDTLFERCYYAFANNLSLLSDKTNIIQLRKKLLPRLQHNRDLLLNRQLKKYITQEVQTWSEDLQQAVSRVQARYFPYVKLDLNL